MNKEQSKLERLTGKYTTSALVAFLFVITLIAFVVTCCLLNEEALGIIDLFTNLLLGQAAALALSLVNDKWTVKVNVDVKNST